MPGAVVGWLLIGYLLASVCYPAWELHTMQAEPGRAVKKITKYQAWNLVHRR